MGSHDIKYLPKVKQQNESKTPKAVAHVPQLLGFWITCYVHILLLLFQQENVKQLAVKPFRILYV
jgi:hypothetical protein